MITLNVKTGTVTNSKEHTPVINSTPWGKMNQTPGYIRGWLPPRYPVPALASADMCIALNWLTQLDGYYAYDGSYPDRPSFED